MPIGYILSDKVHFGDLQKNIKIIFKLFLLAIIQNNLKKVEAFLWYIFLLLQNVMFY